jgi:hypothetical protein
VRLMMRHASRAKAAVLIAARFSLHCGRNRRSPTPRARHRFEAPPDTANSRRAHHIFDAAPSTRHGDRGKRICNIARRAPRYELRVPYAEPAGRGPSSTSRREYRRAGRNNEPRHPELIKTRRHHCQRLTHAGSQRGETRCDPHLLVVALKIGDHADVA